MLVIMDTEGEQQIREKPFHISTFTSIAGDPPRNLQGPLGQSACSFKTYARSQDLET